MTDAPLYFRSHIFFCSNQRPAGHERGCCFSKGAEALRNYMKRQAKELGLTDVRINNAGCLDRCAESLDKNCPAVGSVVVIYPEGVWYRPQNEADIDEILTRHVQGGQRVERLMLANQRVEG